MERLTALEITGQVLAQLSPIWLALGLILFLSFFFKRRLGLYGQILEHPLGLIGVVIVMFWILVAIFADLIVTHDYLAQVSGMKNKGPGWAMPLDVLEAAKVSGTEIGSHYLLGGDNLARDIFSRVIKGSQIVLIIAPLATLFAFMVGVTLGLPAGFYMGRLDTVLSFLANLVLAFPVILLFYLLVTKDIVETGIPMMLAGFLFLFPIIFFCILMYTKYRTRPEILVPSFVVILVVGFWLYLTAVVTPLAQPESATGIAWNAFSGLVDYIRLFDMNSNMLNIFVSVVFVNSPTVFRIVRGLVIDIKTRDYVAAAQTRGESPWYIMLWEILPNTRGPLIVDFCLRIGYTTILLGTLGFFGLGFSPESPDWGNTINEGRKLLLIYAHAALPPAIALMSLVLGLNFLADGLREESLKD
ncbi:MAG: ABC transporter permease [Pseudomonadota bacterium]